ncbi:hypothetical protein TNCV_687051 [Trichonephila clavipes]|nr:hypothetical protein TNCV_687051 [Trichonephila clavipes]
MWWLLSRTRSRLVTGSNPDATEDPACRENDACQICRGLKSFRCFSLRSINDIEKRNSAVYLLDLRPFVAAWHSFQLYMFAETRKEFPQ